VRSEAAGPERGRHICRGRERPACPPLCHGRRRHLDGADEPPAPTRTCGGRRSRRCSDADARGSGHTSRRPPLCASSPFACRAVAALASPHSRLLHRRRHRRRSWRLVCDGDGGPHGGSNDGEVQCHGPPAPRALTLATTLATAAAAAAGSVAARRNRRGTLEEAIGSPLSRRGAPRGDNGEARLLLSREPLGACFYSRPIGGGGGGAAACPHGMLIQHRMWACTHGVLMQHRMLIQHVGMHTWRARVDDARLGRACGGRV
jgi:hypothetical protein